MIITMTSKITGQESTMVLPITREQWREWTSPHRIRSVQDIFPQLDKEEREFLISGITPTEWSTHVKTKDE